jgi:hypothetical protein
MFILSNLSSNGLWNNFNLYVFRQKHIHYNKEIHIVFHILISIAEILMIVS